MDVDAAKAYFSAKVADLRAWALTPLSETDTRCKLIDFLLTECLGWEEDRIRREAHVVGSDGYIDYILATTHPYFVIEAKRAEIDFGLIHASQHIFKMKGVLKEKKQLMSAIHQARDYAIAKGVLFCCVTNGHQYAFFRSQNSEGIDWLDHDVIVFDGFEQITARFDEFFALLSHDSVVNGRLPRSLPVSRHALAASRQFCRLHSKADALLRTRDRNRLFPYLREIIRRVFQSLDADGGDTEILEHCYVESPRESNYEHGLGALLKDQNALIAERAQKVTVNKKDADSFQRTIQGTATENKAIPEVLLILGGIGAGKTTFIHRFRQVLAKESIDQLCLWAYVNFNRFSDTGEDLLRWVSGELFESLKRENPNEDFDSWDVLKQVYHREYEQMRRGPLAPVWNTDRARFDEKFSDKMLQMMDENEKHVVRVIAYVAQKLGRRPFLVFDNADQHDASTQNKVFLIAQKLANDLKCSSIIALREESFWRNRTFGALSAFHAVSYHIEAPRLERVLSKRFKYAKKLIAEGKFTWQNQVNDLVISAQELAKVFDLIVETVLGTDKRFIEFAEYLSPGELRRPLDFMATFLYSGHTNIDSLVRAVREDRKLTIGFHEYIAAIMLGDREYYSENASEIINLFAVDGTSDASHFNRIAILGRLSHAHGTSGNSGHGFLALPALIDDCSEMGMGTETSSAIVSFLVLKGLVQTDTQGRDPAEQIEKVRITSAGVYYLQTLCLEFAYLDLVLAGTDIHNGPFSEKLQKITQRIESLSAPAQRLNRLRCRLERVDMFLQYLDSEFANSSFKSHSDLLDPLASNVVKRISDHFAADKKNIMENAKRVLGK